MLILSLLIGLAVFSSSLQAQVTPLIKPFPDVLVTHPYYEAILYLRANNIVQGNPDGTFWPDSSINRAEFTKILVEAVAEQDVIDTCLQNAPTLFSDIEPDAWYAKYVCTAKKFGMAFGNPDGTYRPANALNFVEAATLVARNLGVVNQLPQPTEEWYRPFVEGMAFEHAIPLTINHFAKPITRGEMAEMIYRIKADIPLRTSQTYEKLAELSKKAYTPPAKPSPATSSQPSSAASSASAGSSMPSSVGASS